MNATLSSPLATSAIVGTDIVMNALSRSKIERLWAPVVAVMFVLSLFLLIRG
jgi:hypothetical protein